jgi:hypothetical protein
MTATKRRFAAAMLAAVMPLAAISIATAAPSFAESTCATGQAEFNGSCVDSCNKSQVRNADSGKCQSLLSAALQKAETPAVAKLTPDQLGGAYQVARQAQLIPGQVQQARVAMDVVDTVVDIPVAAAAATSDAALTLAYLGFLPGSGNGIGNFARTATATGGAVAQTFSAATDVAGVARGLPSPKIGVPKLPRFGLPKVGFPPHPKIGKPRFGMPKLGGTGICGPKLLFFTPCL